MEKKISFAKYIPLIVIFNVISLVVFGIAIFFGASLVITIPFVLVPFFFVFQVYSSEIVLGNEVDNKKVWVIYKNYYSPVYRGVYSLVACLVKAIIWSVVVSSISMIIFFMVSSSVSPEFAELFANMSSLMEEGEIESFYNAIYSNPLFSIAMCVVPLLEGGVFLVFFLRSLMSNSLLVYARNLTPFMNMNAVSYIYKKTITSPELNYKKRLSSYLGLGLLIAGLGYLVGCIGGYFIFSSLGYIESFEEGLSDLTLASFSSIEAIGGFFGVLSLSFYLPRFFDKSREQALEFIPLYRKNAVKVGRDALDELRRSSQATEEQIREMEEALSKTFTDEEIGEDK